MARGYLIILGGGGILGLAYLAGALGYPWGSMAQPGPGLYPFVVGILIVISALGAGLEARVRRLRVRAVWPKGRDRWRVLAVLGSSLAYLLLLPYLGHAFNGTLVALVVLHFTGLRRWTLKIGLALGIGLGSYYLFSSVLNVPLPAGIWLD